MFKNRIKAAKMLVKELKKLNLKNPVVVALPRGGIPIGVEVAKELNAPFDILFVKKIPSPINKEVAIGSVSENGLVFINKKTVDFLLSKGVNIDEEYIQQTAMEKIQEIARKREKYDIEPILLEEKDVIIVDDGIATGASMYLAANTIIRDMPTSIIIAAPVAPRNEELMNMLKQVSSQVVILEQPENFISVGQWYEDFHQLSDKEVKEYLEKVKNQTIS